MAAGRTDILSQRGTTTVDDWLAGLRRRIVSLPPKSKITVEVATNDNGDIHNHRITEMSDGGPLSRN